MAACACLQSNPIAAQLLQTLHETSLDEEVIYGSSDIRPWSHVLVTSPCAPSSSDVSAKRSKVPLSNRGSVTSGNVHTKDFIQRNISSPHQIYRFYHHSSIELHMEQYRKLHTVMARMYPHQPVNSSVNSLQTLYQQQQQQMATNSTQSVPANHMANVTDPWEKWRVPPVATNNSSLINQKVTLPLDKLIISTVPNAIITSDNSNRIPLEVQGEVVFRRALFDDVSSNNRNEIEEQISTLHQRASRMAMGNQTNRSTYPDVRDGSSEHFASVLHDRLMQLQSERQKSAASLRNPGVSDDMEEDESIPYFTEARPSSVGRLASYGVKMDRAMFDNGEGGLQQTNFRTVLNQRTPPKPLITFNSVSRRQTMNSVPVIRRVSKPVIIPNTTSTNSISSRITNNIPISPAKETHQFWTNPTNEGPILQLHNSANFPHFPARSLSRIRPSRGSYNGQYRDSE